MKAAATTSEVTSGLTRATKSRARPRSLAVALPAVSGAKPTTPPTPDRLGAGEAEVDLLRLLGADRHLLLLRAQLLVPHLDRVLARRHVLDRERPVLAAHGEERVLEDSDVRLHPGMHVALHGDRDLLARERLLE